MIKKFTFVFSLTLISQIISLFAISFIVKKEASATFIEFIALLDSSYLLINTILSFGIVQIATREVVVSENWKKIIENTQNIRFNFSLFLFLLGVVLYYISKKEFFLTFLLSPLLALNVNYLFYAKGKPEIATKNSSIRVIILSLTLICLGLFQYFSNKIYLICFILGLLYVAYSSNSLSKTKANFNLSLHFFKEYFKNIGVGITDLAIIFLEFGILFFASFFYQSTIIAEAYILIKLITVIKGFQRMVFQVFYNQLIDNKIVIFLDKFILFTGFSFFIICFLFSNEMLLLLYSKNDLILQRNLILFSLALLIASIILASMARTLILRNDKIYVRSYILSLMFSFSTMIVLSYTTYNEYGISISLLVGELVLFLSFLIGIKKDIDLKQYLLMIIGCCFLIVLYIFISKLFEKTITFAIVITVQCVIFLCYIFQNKKIITR